MKKRSLQLSTLALILASMSNANIYAFKKLEDRLAYARGLSVTSAAVMQQTQGSILRLADDPMVAFALSEQFHLFRALVSDDLQLRRKAIGDSREYLTNDNFNEEKKEFIKEKDKSEAIARVIAGFETSDNQSPLVKKMIKYAKKFVKKIDDSRPDEVELRAGVSIYLNAIDKVKNKVDEQLNQCDVTQAAREVKFIEQIDNIEKAYQATVNKRDLVKIFIEKNKNELNETLEISVYGAIASDENQRLDFLSSDENPINMRVLFETYLAEPNNVNIAEVAIAEKIKNLTKLILNQDERLLIGKLTTIKEHEEVFIEKFAKLKQAFIRFIANENIVLEEDQVFLVDVNKVISEYEDNNNCIVNSKNVQTDVTIKGGAELGGDGSTGPGAKAIKL